MALKHTPVAITLIASFIVAEGPIASAQVCPPEEAYLSADFLAGSGFFHAELDLADLDGDGDLDAVAVNFPHPVVYLNNGATDPTVMELTDSGRGLFVDLTDLDGDSIVDLVLSLFNDGGIEVRYGLGDGTFAPPAVYPLRPWTTREVRAIDMNGDGMPDLVAVQNVENTLSILMAAGDGTFLPAETYSTQAEPRTFTPVDLDLDGWVDIVVPNQEDGDVSIFMNQGDGTLGTPTNVIVGGIPSQVAAGDFNGNGLPDLVVASGDESSAVLLGLGDGTFESALPLFVPVGSGRVSILDYNGDDHLDLACYTPGWIGNSKIAWMYTGQGDGTFTPAGSYYTAHAVVGIVADDWTGDNIDDLVIVGAGGLRIAPGNGDGSLDALPAVAAGGASVDAVDMNGDGILDLVGFDSAGYIRTSLGLGDGNFGMPISTSVPHSIWYLTQGDIDGDGDIDLVGGTVSDRTVVVLLGNGDGTLTLGSTYTTYHPVRKVVLADVDEDGELDLLVAHFDRTRIALRRGNGDGTFQAIEQIVIGKTDLVVADFDGDGHLDLASSAADSFVRKLGNGDGTFGPSASFAMPILSNASSGVGLSSADINGDGVLDILAAGAITPPGEPVVIALAVCLGIGDGSFAEVMTFPTGQETDGVRTIAIDDFDGDGVLDVAVAISSGSTVPVSVLRGLGDGSFGSHALFMNGTGSWDMTTGDFNADGLADLAVANLADRNVTVMLNQCSGMNGCIVDFNGDGVLDFFDVTEFLSLFSAEDPSVDLTNDGMFNFFDVSEFLTLFAAGCP